MLPTYAWVLGHPLICLPGTARLQKTDPSPPGSHQLSIVPRLEVGAHGPLPIPGWKVDWLDPVQATTVVMSLSILLHPEDTDSIF